jgi:uncharacterized protein
VEFEWDEEKRQRNYEKHGVDFLKAALIFEGAILTKRDTRRDYGEERMLSLGLVAGVPYCVAYTQRQGRIRIISAWKGGRKEYDIYQNHFTGSA